MLVAGQHPGDLVEIDAVFVLQNAAHPDAGRHCEAAADADLLALEVLRRADAGLGVDQDGAVMEGAHQRHWNSRHRLAELFGANVGGDRHLADVELVGAHHAAESCNQRIDLDEIQLAGLRFDLTGLERPVVALAPGNGFQLRSGHSVLLPSKAEGRRITAIHRPSYSFTLMRSDSRLRNAELARQERIFGGFLERLVRFQHDRNRPHALVRRVDARRDRALVGVRLGGP